MKPDAGNGNGIELRGLKKTYRSPRGPVHAVRGIEVAVEPGETVALLGPNGAGKTTTVDMLLGLQQPDEGSVEVFGGPPERAVQSGRIGAMLQAGGVLRDLTVRELLAMMATLFPKPLDIDETLELAKLDGLADRRTERLSGGETQRLRFAVALVSDPDLLVLDEPTVGMDVEARRAFWSTVRELSGTGKTFLFATHYLEEADAYADRVVLMARGRIVADGPTTEIKALVGSRTISATLDDVPIEALERLPAVTRAERHGEAVVLSSSDSDRTLREFLDAYPQAADIEVRGAGLEEAFLQLTADEEEEVAA
jgi:ABC-2 type transport system ATP-binding protein